MLTKPGDYAQNHRPEVNERYRDVSPTELRRWAFPSELGVPPTKKGIERDASLPLWLVPALARSGVLLVERIENQEWPIRCWSKRQPDRRESRYLLAEAASRWGFEQFRNCTLVM